MNQLATAELARAAAAAGVRRFVFMSSMRAQAGAAADQPLTEADAPRPTDAYGRSKLAAEAAVRAAGVPYTILRPALVYGPGAKGNLASLMRLAALAAAASVRRVLQPPLAARARQSDRRHALRARRPARQRTRHSSSPIRNAISVAELVAMLRAAAGRRPWLVPVPPALARCNALRPDRQARRVRAPRRHAGRRAGRS